MPINLVEEREVKKTYIPEPRKYDLTEVNLQKWPFFLLSRKGLRKKPEVSYEHTVEQNGIVKKLIWQVTGNSKYGYPGPFDKKVKAAIDQIICENGFPVINPIPFTVYDLCKRLNIGLGGRNKRKVKTAIKRISASLIETKGFFYDKGIERHRDAVFHLFDVLFMGEIRPDTGDEAEKNYLFLSDIYRASWNSFYVKPLDYNYFISLDSDIARRLYELLSVKFFGIFEHQREVISIRYKEELTKLLPVEPQPYFSLAQSKLENAHEELIRTEFLKDVNWTRTDKDFIVHYQPGRKAREDYGQRQLRQIELPFNGNLDARLTHKEKEKAEVDSKADNFKEMLITEGVSSGIAQRLASEYKEETITFREQEYNLIEFEIEHYQWAKEHLTKDQQPRGPKWLPRAIKEHWFPSERGFLTSREQREAEEKKRENRQKEEELEQQRQEANAKRLYLEWLKRSPEERWNEFEFKSNFKSKYGRKPTVLEINEGRKAYLEDPETPEEYQERVFGEVKYPEYTGLDKSGK